MSRKFFVDILMGGVARVKGLLDPVDPQDAATKAYVDSVATTAPVLSVNGETGVLTDYAKTDINNNFTVPQTITSEVTQLKLADNSGTRLSLGYTEAGSLLSNNLSAEIKSLGVDLAYSSRTSVNSNHRFFTPESGVATERVRIQFDGNVGIGTTGPTEKIDIDGNIRVRNIPAVQDVDFIVLVDTNGVAEKITLSDFIELTQAPTIEGAVITGKEVSVTSYPVGKGPSSAHQWFSDGTPITGATGVTYTITPQDEGKDISLQLDSGLSSNILSNFYPLNISGLDFWFDATFGVTASGNRVTGWENRGDQTFTATPSLTSNQPYYDTLDGMPSVSNNGPLGLTGNMDVSVTEGVLNNHTIISLTKTGPVINGGWQTLTRDYNAGHTLLINGDTSIGHYGGGYTAVPGINMSLSEKTLLSLKYESSTMSLAKNGNTANTVGTNRTASNGSGFRLGGYSTSSQQWGQLSDVVIFNGSLSDSNIKMIEGYLAHKHNFQSQLPASHPYKTEAP